MTELKDTGLLEGLAPPVAALPWAKVLDKVYRERQCKILALADKLNIYTDIDNADEDILDILAIQRKVDWYDQNYPIETKRRIIKTALQIRRFYGTDWATETALQAVYPGSKIVQWYDYGGTPGHFIVKCDISNSWEQPSVAEIKRITNIYKRMTAHLERIRFTATAEKSVIGYTASVVLSMGGRMTVAIPGQIVPHPSTIKGYAAAAAANGVIRALATVKGKVGPQAATVRGYAAACQQGSTASVVVSIGKRIKQ